jgi:hypothetical protein
MSLLNQPTVSFYDFKRALKLKCYKVFGCSYSDLPDVVDLNDFWYEGIEEREAVMMIDGVIEDLAAELNFDLGIVSEEISGRALIATLNT